MNGDPDRQLRTSSPVVLALDVGTSSTRAMVFDAAGRKVGTGIQYSYANTTTPDGGVEVDADALLELIACCIDSVLAELSAPPLGVATSCFWHSMMAVGPDNRPLTPVLSWADNRSAPWIPPLAATLDEDAAHARTGCVFHTSYWPAKLLWLHHTRPELFAAGTRWMSFGEYLALRLFGGACCSLSMASGTGLFHQVNCTWDETTLAALPIDQSNLSPLCDADDAVGHELRAPWAQRWPLLRQVPWFPALGDGACSNIGSGCVDDSCIAMNVGTSGALRTVLREYREAAPHGLWRYRIDRKRSLMGGALSNAGNVYAWVRNTFNLPANSEMLIAAMEPDAHGLTVLPFLAGERSPLWNPDARFIMEGATLDTSPVQILRACLEGASLRFAEVARAVRAAVAVEQARKRAQQKGSGELVPDTPSHSHTPQEVEIVASGGALERSACWTQVMSDCIGAPLVGSREFEASARGAALLALEASGVIGDIAEVPSERGGIVQPCAERHAIYERALARQNTLYEHVFGTALA